MRHLFTKMGLVALAVFLSLVVVTTVQADSGKADTPAMFIENVGQFGVGVRFQASFGGTTAFLTDDGIWFMLSRGADDAAKPDPQDRHVRGPKTVRQVAAKLEFVGSSQARLVPSDRLDTSISYLTGRDASSWFASVPVWGSVTYAGLYPGLDLQITAKNGRWDWRLVGSASADGRGNALAGSADLAQVQLRVVGGDGLSVADGQIRISTELGDLALPLLGLSDGQQPPASPAVLAGGLISRPFALSADMGKVGLSAAYDLVASTFLGGSDVDEVFDIEVGADDSVYVSGYSWSTNFPITPSAFDDELGGDYDAYIAKLSSDASTLIYATFLGGDSDDSANSLSVDDSGYVYVTGSTFSSDFPVSLTAFDNTLGVSGPEQGDAFVTKLNTTGSGIEYSTYLGGGVDDRGWSIEIRDGYAYVSGETWEAAPIDDPFPTTLGANARTFAGGLTDIFLTKVNTTGSRLVFSTLVGGHGDEEGYSIALDAAGNIAICGETSSTGMGTPGAFAETLIISGTQSMDAFVTEVSSDGSDLVFFTYFGGHDSDWAESLTMDPSGNIYVTGYTRSSDLPTTTVAADTSYNGMFDAFVTKFDPTGSSLIYSTYLGGSDDEDSFDIAVDSAGRAHVVGYTFSSDFPVTNGAYDNSLGGNRDAFVAKLKADGSEAIYCSYLGGTDNLFNSTGDWANTITFDSEENTWIAGYTYSSDFPTTVGAYDPIHNGMADAFVAKMDLPDSLYFMVTMQTNAGTTTPTSDFYERGSTLAIDAQAPEMASGSRYAWVGWTGIGNGSYTGNTKATDITVNEAITQTAAWQIEHELTMNATVGTVSPGTGWHDANASVQIQATAPTAASGERYLFGGWTGVGTGSYSGTSNPYTLSMTGPITETASWTQQFKLTMSTPVGTVSPTTGWRNAGASVQIAATPPTPVGGERWVFSGWTGVGTGSYTGTDNPKNITMSGVITETASWNREYELTMQTNAGTVTPISGWKSAGSTQQIQATAPDVVTGERYVWVGWTGTGTGSYTGNDNLHTITVNGPITESASWNHQYMLTVTALPVGVVTIGGTGWRDAGSLASTGSAPLTVPSGDGYYRFTVWTVDRTPVGGNPISVTMNGPHAVVAHYAYIPASNNSPSTVSVSANKTYGTPDEEVIFTAKYNDPDGADDIKYAEILLNVGPDNMDTIGARYDVQLNRIYINNPLVQNAWRTTAYIPGTATFALHVFGKIDLAKCQVTKNGDELTVVWALIPSWRISGTNHNVYLRVEDTDSAADGWDDRGDYVVNCLPNYLIPPTYIPPFNSTVPADTLYYINPGYRDPDKWGDLDEIYLLITDESPPLYAAPADLPTNSVLLMFKVHDPTNRKLWLWYGAGWTKVEENSTETLTVGLPRAIVVTKYSRSIVADVRTLKVNWRLKFRSNFLGRHMVYMRAIDIHGRAYGGDTGWKWKGFIVVQ